MTRGSDIARRYGSLQNTGENLFQDFTSEEDDSSPDEAPDTSHVRKNPPSDEHWDQMAAEACERDARGRALDPNLSPSHGAYWGDLHRNALPPSVAVKTACCPCKGKSLGGLILNQILSRGVGDTYLGQGGVGGGAGPQAAAGKGGGQGGLKNQVK